MKCSLHSRLAGSDRTFFHKSCLGALNKICVKVSSLLLSARHRLARNQHKFPTWWWRKPLAATCVPAEFREQTQCTPTPRKSEAAEGISRHTLLSSRTCTRASPYLDRRITTRMRFFVRWNVNSDEDACKLQTWTFCVTPCIARAFFLHGSPNIPHSSERMKRSVSTSLLAALTACALFIFFC